MNYNKGSELDKQIYKEGESTWGCKSGVLDVEDVKEFIRLLKMKFKIGVEYLEKDIINSIDDLAGKELSGVEE